MLSKYIKNINFFICLIIIFNVPFIFEIINFISNNFFFHDSLYLYLQFNYLSNYLEQFDKPVLWVSDLKSGLKSTFLYIHLGSLGTLLSLIASKLKFWSNYFFFSLTHAIYNIIFLYGILLNFKNSRNKIFIILILSIIYLTTSYNNKQIFFENIFPIGVPYCLYYLRKFLEKKKIINLTKIILVIFLQFNIHMGYIIIASIYYYFLLFLFLFLFNKIKIKNILDNNNVKSYFILFLFLLFLLLFAKIFQKNIDLIFLSSGREGIISSYNSFITIGTISFKELLYSFFIGNFDYIQNDWALDFVFSLGPIGLSIIFFYLTKLNNYNKQNHIKHIFYIVIIFFLIFSIRLSTKDILLYHLPFFSMYRHLGYIIILSKVLLLINIGFIIDLILKEKNVKKSDIKKIISYYVGIITLLIIISKFNLLSFKFIWIILFNILVIKYFLNFLRKKKMKHLVISLGIIFIIFIINNNLIYSFKEVRLKNFYLDNIINHKINYRYDQINCISADEYLKEYSDLFTYKNSAFYGIIEIILDKRPCANIFRFDFENTKKIKSNFDKNFELKKINNEKYEIISNSNKNLKGLINISYDKKWQIKFINKINANEVFKEKIDNYHGYIKINKNINNLTNYNIFLFYDNKFIYFYFYSNIFIGLLTLIFLFKSIFQNLNKNNSN